MTNFYLGVILFAGLLALLMNFTDSKTKRQRRTRDPFRHADPEPTSIPQISPTREKARARSFMNATETDLFYRLQAAFSGQPIDVHAQVALSALIDADRRRDYAGYARVSQKSVDFVITRRHGTLKGLTVVAAIELDGSYHDLQSRKAKDADKDAIFQEAGIRLIRWTVRDMPTIADIRRQLL